MEGDEFFSKKIPNTPNRKSHNDLNSDLEVLTKNLNSKSKEDRRVHILKKQLTISVFTM